MTRLRLLRNQRQKEMMTDKMKDDKPLADVLKTPHQELAKPDCPAAIGSADHGSVQH